MYGAAREKELGGWRNCTVKNFIPSTLHLLLLLLLLLWLLYQLE
jgi:hypothetical protein